MFLHPKVNDLLTQIKVLQRVYKLSKHLFFQSNTIQENNSTLFMFILICALVCCMTILSYTDSILCCTNIINDHPEEVKVKEEGVDLYNVLYLLAEIHMFDTKFLVVKDQYCGL